MSRINLLPWREELRQERQQQFFITVGIAAAFALGIWGIVHFYHTQLVENQQTRNQYLEDQLVLLDKKIEEIKRLESEKERLLSRMRAIERLQGNRPLVVRLFDELVASLPDGVSVRSVSQKGKTISIDGVAQSNARVSSFMRKLEKSEWLEKPQLSIIQAKDEEGRRISNFQLSFSQVIPGTGEEEES